MRWCALFLLIIINSTGLQAQVWVEIISRSDSIAFLCAGCDNKIRVHNMPPGATVKIESGAAIPVGTNEFILCRIHAYDKADLIISLNGDTLFRRTYKIIFTGYSGSIYNPIPKQTKVKFGNLTKHRDVSYEELEAAVKEGFIIEDTACAIQSVVFAILPKGKDYMGPFTMYCPPAGRCHISDYIKNIIFKNVGHSSRIFIENIIIDCPADKNYAQPSPILISVKSAN